MITDTDAEKIGHKMLGRGLGQAAAILARNVDNPALAAKLMAEYARAHSPEASEGFCSVFHGAFKTTNHNLKKQ